MAPDTLVGGRSLPLVHIIRKWLGLPIRYRRTSTRLRWEELSEARKRDLGLADGRFHLKRDAMRD
ncbi:hypothetical protein [Afifella sp. IM 167]|uniref:hypothetical protein n=1 Tax=Afifella sp. IM 167 TaxID=2033586 RepID=UPI001CCBE2DE|nr:hypothetical protein [Afifella sp. IM 167]MBZ8132784.1 hypothetical protein [Afifella sp. IM 167]